MKNTFGNSVSLTFFGESHGEAVGAVIDGLAPGIAVEDSFIADRLSRRRPSGETESARREPDDFRILSGVFQGKTTGTPLCIVIPNTDTRSGDYVPGQARPSHADYTAFRKYHGFEDYRGGGHFSGRVTAAAVAAGAVLTMALDPLGIRIGTHILRCGSVEDRSFPDTEQSRQTGAAPEAGRNFFLDTEQDLQAATASGAWQSPFIGMGRNPHAAATPGAWQSPFIGMEQELRRLRTADFPVLSEDCAEPMREEIRRAKADGDSIGGITQTAVMGLPAGLGEPWFDTVEGMLSHALFGVGGIKGIEFGSGFSGVLERGSVFNDPLRMENGRVTATSNHSGGINGGLTSGMPVVFSCAVRPTPSIGKEQDSVNFITGENIRLSVSGRHDPAIIRRVCPVIDSITALVFCDLVAMRYGTDVFTEGIKSET